MTTALAVVAALGLGFVTARLGSDDIRLAVLICLLPLVPLVLLRSRTAAVAAVGCLPFELNVVGGAVGGLNVSASDLLLAAATAGLVLALSQDRDLRQRLRVLAPLRPLFVLYLAAMLVVSAVHPGVASLVNAVQRVEIVVVPVVLATLVLTERAARRGLALFTVAALVLGVRWLLPHGAADQLLGVQKNPAGQYLADAALLSLSVFAHRRVRFLLFPLLVVCTYATQSRGALVGLLAGLVALALVRARDPLQFVLRVLPVVLVVGAVYAVLPAEEQARIRGNTVAVEYSDRVRQQFAEDARAIIRAHPVLGIGIGNYLAGDASDLSLTDDPHDILLLEAAEGGGVLLAAFLVLQVGALVLVVRRRHRTPWAAAAAAVQVSILTHSLLDVYWVRGTPVLGWLLVGMTVSAASLAVTSEPDDDVAPAAPVAVEPAPPVPGRHRLTPTGPVR